MKQPFDINSPLDLLPLVTEFYAHGLPAPQGSKRHLGHGVMVESSSKTKPWRQAVQIAARDHYEGAPINWPVIIQVQFFFPRPKRHFGTGKFSDRLKATAPYFADSSRHGDLDKLLRATSDALAYTTGGSIVSDDRLIVGALSLKRYADAENPPGARIKVALAFCH